MLRPSLAQTAIPAIKPLASEFSMPSKSKLKITALAGGVGASKLLFGLYQEMDPARLTAIVNTGDDIVLHGLRISPDLDIVTYTLAGVIDPAKGWGFRGETFHALKRLAVFGRVDWFNLGDRDLATHIHRTAMLAEGKSLSEAAESIRAAPGVLEAIRDADRIIICPSNPLISIGPILAVRGVREALRARRKEVIAVCPIVGGKSLKGPSDKMLAQLGYESSAQGVAKLYADFTGTIVVDPVDQAQARVIESLNMRVAVLPTVMTTRREKRRLARGLLRL